MATENLLATNIDGELTNHEGTSNGLSQDDFFSILDIYIKNGGLSGDFVEYLKTVPYKYLQILGLTKIDPFTFLKQYFGNGSLADVSVDPNANVGKRAPNNLQSELIKPFMKIDSLHLFWKYGMMRFGRNITDPILQGKIYLHDSTKARMYYCVGIATSNLIHEGRPYNLRGTPPNNLASFVGQVEELIMDMSQQFAGAVACSDLPICMAYYTKDKWFKERVKSDAPKTHHVYYTDGHIENRFQSLVHKVNNKFRVGGDSPFTNLSVNSWPVIEDIFNHYKFPDGTTIFDFKREIMRIQKIIVDFMARGDPSRGGTMYRFPVITLNLKKSDLDNWPSTDGILEYEPLEDPIEWFIPYAIAKNGNGFLNINRGEKFSMCCKLNLDIKKMLKYRVSSGPMGAQGVNIGSHRVFTINLPMLAYEANSMISFFSLLNTALDEIEMMAIIHKEFILKEMEKKQFLMFFNPLKWLKSDMFFSTIGFHGLSEAVDILINRRIPDVGDEFRRDFMVDILKKMVDSANYFSRDGLIFNVEQTPAEGCTATMAAQNNFKFGTRDKYYSNQFVPFHKNVSMSDRVKFEGKCSNIITGGSMCHVNIENKLTPQQSLDLHHRILSNSDISQYAVNLGETHCVTNHEHAHYGMKDSCPDCGGDVVHKTRVVGYSVFTSDMSKTRQEEVTERLMYRCED